MDFNSRVLKRISFTKTLIRIRPPVSLAMGLASAAAHAHYVNGMVGGRGDGHHYPTAALHAAAAAAAAAASSAAAAQRAEIEREEVDRERGKFIPYNVAASQ